MFSIQSVDIAHFLFAMGCLLAVAHLLGFLAERIMIPRVIGEISAGLVLGPTLLLLYLLRLHLYPLYQKYLTT